MAKFVVAAPVAEAVEKIRIAVPASTMAWAQAQGKSSGVSTEEVLTQAIAYARRTQEKAARKAAGKAAKPTEAMP
jgi:flagellar hook-basal body complex protein FliE